MSGDLTRADRRDEYHQVLRIVDANTGGAQPALASVSSITQIASSAGVTEPGKRLRAAVENDDVVTLEGRVCLAEPEAIRAAIEAEAQSEHPREDRIGWLNRVLQEVKDGE
ncbi:MAG: hypothetical protein ACOCQL_05855 [Halolamina sp.]